MKRAHSGQQGQPCTDVDARSRRGKFFKVRNVLASVLLSILVGGAVFADSFMSSTEFVANDGVKLTEDTEAGNIDDQILGPSVHEMLAVMQWKSAESDRVDEFYDLGNGVRSPQDPKKALFWSARVRRAIGPGYRFLALYKANWDAANADLIAEMQRVKTELAFKANPDAGRQAVMALGIALAALQVDRKNSLSNVATPVSRYAGSSFAEAIAQARSLEEKRATERQAIRKAIQSAWKYIESYYEAITVEFKKYMTPSTLQWLESDQ